MSEKKNKNSWYITGLYFECMQCGQCCSGPGEGYIWVTKPEVGFIANFLKIPEAQLRRRYLRRVGFRMTIIEQSDTKDCMFLQNNDSQKVCMIYPVRPNQCRTWPFWSSNLASPDSWNKAIRKCGGINRRRYYNFAEIEKMRKEKKWWYPGDSE